MPLSKKRVDRVPTYDPMEENKKLPKQQVNWNEKYKELVGYKEEHGDCNVPPGYSKNNQKLGYWVSRQRKYFVKGKYSEERYQERFYLLKKIGFIWDPHKDQWDDQFTKLTLYKEENGNCNVPQSHSGGFGKWVIRQRYSQHNGSLSTDRLKRLNDLGFCWNPPRGNGGSRRVCLEPPSW